MFRKKDQEGPRPTPGSPSTAPAPSQAGPATPPPATPKAPAAQAAPTPSPRAEAGADAAGGKRLIVGQGLSLSGDITACDLLVVEGTVQVTLNDTRAIEISESGRFTNGKAAVEEATISGVYEGELTVRGRLLVRGTGRVDGTIHYGELEVERGGRLTGTVALLEKGGAKPAEAAKPASPVTPTAAASTNAPANTGTAANTGTGASTGDKSSPAGPATGKKDS